jgi:lipopolysaccharide heptosyltransferase II
MFHTRIDLAALEPERVLLIKPSSLGDVVHALPVLRAIRKRWPTAHLAWVVNSGLRGLIDGHPDLDEVIPFDRSALSPRPEGWSRTVQWARNLRGRGFELAIDLQGLLKSGIMAWSSGAAVRVGLAEAREAAGWFYTHRIPAPSGARHMVERMMAVARAFGCEGPIERVPPALTEAARGYAAGALSGVPRPMLGVNLGARWLTKRWPAESFAALGRRARDEFGAGIVLVGAPEDRDLARAFEAALGARADADLCGRTSLPELSAVLERLDVLVSNDTGPLHLGCAVGTRCVGIYTCTSPAATGPYSTRAIAVETRVWCAASRLKSCRRMDCMTELDVERVWPAVRTQLITAAADRKAA